MVNLSGPPGAICAWGSSPFPVPTHWMLNQYEDTACIPPDKPKLSPVRALPACGELMSYQEPHTLRGSAPRLGPPCQHSLTLGGSTQVGRDSSRSSSLQPVGFHKAPFISSQPHPQGS